MGSGGAVNLAFFEAQLHCNVVSVATQALEAGLPNKEAVFSWMQKSFGTRMVMDLKPSEVLRTRRYVETIHRRMNREKT